MAFFIILVTACFSEGFLHPDEHYQILELLNLKLPNKFTDLSIFNWDYHLSIRSWFQPFIYYILIYPVKFLSGFQLAFILRFLTGFLGVFSLNLFICLFKDKEEAAKLTFFTALVWYVPFLLVRTSSESLSLSLFFIGLYLHEKGKNKTSMLLWGMSFLARFQMALMIAPIIIIDLFRKKLSLRKSIGMLGILLVILGVGVLIDFWGYDHWVVSPYNYFYQNLILGKASHFGIRPFYYYLTQPLYSSLLLPGLLVLYFGGQFLWKLRHQAIFWGLVSFFLIHSFIPHKEVRFLIPIYIVFTVGSLIQIFEIKKYKIAFKAFLIINILVMSKTSFSPAHSTVTLYKKIHQGKANQFYVLKEEKGFKFIMPFYMKETIRLDALLEDFEGKNILTLRFKSFQALQKKASCRLQDSQYPVWIEKLNFFNWLKRSSFFAFWSC